MKEKPMIMKYRDELDKSYGVAGMALGLSVLDASDLFTAVTLDGDDTGCIQYRISVGLAVANALCRRMVLDNDKADNQLRDQLFNIAFADGRDYCQLERDEVEPIFDEAFENMTRLFGDARVRHAMDSFVDTLQQRRTLSHIDVIDILQQLNLA